MSERTRFEHLEMEERPRRRAAPRERTRERAPVRQISAAPPGAVFTPNPLLEPILQNTLAPAGRPEFHYLYDQISGLADALSGSGPLAPTIGDISDVNLTNLTDGDILVWDETTGEWVNQQPAGLGGETVTFTNIQEGDTIVYQGGEFVNTPSNQHVVTDATTAGESPAVSLHHRLSSGTATVGHGVAQDFYGENALGADLLHASVWTQTEDVTGGSEDVGLVFSNRVNGSFGERVRISGATGNLNALTDLASQTGVNVGSLLNRAGWLHIHPAAVDNPEPIEQRLLYIQGPAHVNVGNTADHAEVDFALNRTVNIGGGNRSDLVSVVRITPPTWTLNSPSTYDQAATFFVNGPPVASTNLTLTERYAAFFNGEVRIDASLSNGITSCFRLPQDETDPTGGGGAALGRIPIRVNGVLAYLAYYAS